MDDMFNFLIPSFLLVCSKKSLCSRLAKLPVGKQNAHQEIASHVWLLHSHESDSHIFINHSKDICCGCIGIYKQEDCSQENCDACLCCI